MQSLLILWVFLWIALPPPFQPVLTAEARPWITQDTQAAVQTHMVHHNNHQALHFRKTQETDSHGGTDVHARIPRVLHQTYSAAHRLSPLAQNLMGTFRVNHPAWTVAFWDDNAAEEFVSARYPSYADIYRKLKRPVMRADMLRLMLMDAYGGVYADVDVESVQPLERLLDVGGIAGTASCVVSPEPRAHGAILEGLPHRAMVSNAVFASKPGHALWRMALEEIRRSVHSGDGDPVSLTGPRLLSKVYHQLRNRPNDDEQCTMLPVEVLNPAADVGALGGRVREVCEEYLLTGKHIDKPNLPAPALAERKQECELLRGRGYVQAPRDNVASYTAHHWVHTWIPGYQPHSSVGDTFRSAVPIAQYDMTVLSDTDLRSRMADVGVNLPDAPPLPKSSVLTNHLALERALGLGLNSQEPVGMPHHGQRRRNLLAMPNDGTQRSRRRGGSASNEGGQRPRRRGGSATSNNEERQARRRRRRRQGKSDGPELATWYTR